MLVELSQFGFMASIFFMVYIIIGITMKFYGKFIEKEDTKFVLTPLEKIMLWLSLSYVFTFII